LIFYGLTSVISHMELLIVSQIKNIMMSIEQNCKTTKYDRK